MELEFIGYQRPLYEGKPPTPLWNINGYTVDPNWFTDKGWPVPEERELTEGERKPQLIRIRGYDK